LTRDCARVSRTGGCRRSFEVFMSLLIGFPLRLQVTCGGDFGMNCRCADVPKSRQPATDAVSEL
jgi:hypothetical protein